MTFGTMGGHYPCPSVLQIYALLLIVNSFIIPIHKGEHFF